MSIATDNKASEEQIDYAARKQEAVGFKEKGNTFVQKKEYEPALKMYSRAIELCNNDPVFYSNRSQCYLSLEKYKECIEDATRAIELDPKSAKSFYRQMMAYEKLGDDFKALRSCRQWLDLSPDDQACKNSYDKIHNRIMDAERKKDKEKIRWARLGSTAEVVHFVSRPPHLRSKKPIKKVPVRLRKAASPIHEAIIDKIFGNNTGERTPEPETDSKLFRPNFLIADPFKSSPKLAESPKAEKSVVSKVEVIVAQEGQAPNEAADVPTLEELEAQKTHLISIPLTSVQFYSAWKELNEVQKFLYLKNIAENSVPIGKLLGAQIDSEILSNILAIVHKYFRAFKIPAICFLNDLGKNSEVVVLAMFLNDEEKSSKSALESLKVMETSLRNIFRDQRAHHGCSRRRRQLNSSHDPRNQKLLPDLIVK